MSESTRMVIRKQYPPEFMTEAMWKEAQEWIVQVLAKEKP